MFGSEAHATARSFRNDFSWCMIIPRPYNTNSTRDELWTSMHTLQQFLELRTRHLVIVCMNNWWRFDWCLMYKKVRMPTVELKAKLTCFLLFFAFFSFCLPSCFLSFVFSSFFSAALGFFSFATAFFFFWLLEVFCVPPSDFACCDCCCSGAVNPSTSLHTHYNILQTKFGNVNTRESFLIGTFIFPIQINLKIKQRRKK